MSDLRPDARSVGGLAVVLRQVGWGSVCAVAVLLLQSLFHQPVGALTICLVVALLALTAFAPFTGLLVLASFGPLSAVLFNLTTASSISIQFAETLTLAFIAGWTGQRTLRPRPLAISPGTRWAAMLLLAAATASGIAQWATIRAENLGEPVTALIQSFVTRDYLLHLAGSAPITAAALVCEGALLLLIAADVCARSQAKRDSVLGVMVLGAAAAGSLNLLRIVTASMAQEDVWTALLHYLRMLRVNVQYADVNAAGSYFALMLPIALGFLARRRAFAFVCLPMIVAGLWLSGSRFALGGAFAALGIGALFALRGRWRRAVPILSGLLVLGVVAGGLWKFYPEGRNRGAVSVAALIRVELARAGLQMAGDHLVFGVGLGQFYNASARYVGPALTKMGYLRENAHNDFIQILAELGVPGLLLFLTTLAVSLRELWRGSSALSLTSIGLFTGLGAFLLTCLGGHPLLVPEAAYPFWLCLGLAATPLAAIPTHTPRALRYLGVGVLIAFTATLPTRAADAVRHADMANVNVGLSRWQHEPDGSRFRWAADHSTFYVTSTARAVRIPLRNGHAVGGTLEIRVFLNGREADRVRLAPDQQWWTLRLILTRSDSKFSRIDLIAAPLGTDAPLQIPATDRSGMMQIGRVEIEE